jgi:hypothetical protein
MKNKRIWAVMMVAGLLSACGGGGGAASEEFKSDLEQLKSSANKLSSYDPKNEDYSDLAAFGAAVGDKRIVFLTEALHGPDNLMLLNTRLLKYLHKEKGFDVVLIESGMFDLSRMEEIRNTQKVNYADSAPGRIFWGWSRSNGGLPFIKYLDETANSERPMRFAGIDYFALGESAVNDFIPRYEHFMAKNNSAALQSAQWATYRSVLKNIISFEVSNRPSDPDLNTFRNLSTQIDAELCNTPYAGEAPLNSKSYWCRISKTLQQETLYLWHDDTPEASKTEIWHVPRDIAQAANAQWWLEGPYKGKKAIIWTHAYHGLVASEKNKLGQDVVNTASELVKLYPGQIFTNHITTRESAYGSSVEAHLASTHSSMLYLNYPTSINLQNRLKELTIAENGFVSRKPNHFGSSYQSLFMIPSAGAWTVDFDDLGKYPRKNWPQPLE